MLKKYALYTLICCLGLLLLTCKKEKEDKTLEQKSLEGVVSVTAPKPLTINSTNFTDSKTVDTLRITDNGQEKKYPVKEITIKETINDTLKFGSVIIDTTNGYKQPYLIVSAPNPSGRMPGGKIDGIIRAIKAPFSFLYNQDSKPVQFIGALNRSKSNTTIAEKLSGTPTLGTPQYNYDTAPDEDGVDVGFAHGVSFNLSNSSQNGFLISFKDVGFKGSTGSVALSGSIRINPSFDFYMQYSPVSVIPVRVL